MRRHPAGRGKVHEAGHGTPFAGVPGRADGMEFRGEEAVPAIGGEAARFRLPLPPGEGAPH